MYADLIVAFNLLLYTLIIVTSVLFLLIYDRPFLRLYSRQY